MQGEGKSLDSVCWLILQHLLESYNLLIDFIKKHTDDKFFLIDGVNVSVRTAIAREIVSNLLVYR